MVGGGGGGGTEGVGEEGDDEVDFGYWEKAELPAQEPQSDRKSVTPEAGTDKDSPQLCPETWTSAAYSNAV